MRDLATPPQCNQESLMVRDNVGRPQVSLGRASLWNVIIFSFQGFTVGWRHPACKKLGVGLLVVMI